MTDPMDLNRDLGETGLMVRSVRLVDFRNYERLDLELSAGLAVVCGANAQGKTNLLEGLYLLSAARLLRGQRDAEAIREGAPSARVEAELAPVDTIVAMHLQAGARKRAFLNAHPLPRASDLLGRLPAVCISAEDLSLARGEPADRRLFLDLELAALYPAYLKDLAVYKRALEQRNALLRHAADAVVADAQFEPWEEQLGRHGDSLRLARNRYVERLDTAAATLHERLAPGERLAVAYVARDASEDSLGALARRRQDDIRRGSTSIGPHRDELSILTGGRDVRLFGSQGQQRTTTISIKMAAMKLAEEDRGAPPLLLLDDVFSDLDERRREALVDLVLGTAGQVVLTCTEASAAGPRVLDLARVYEVRAGTVTTR